jgi:hypothetical protein
MNGTYYPKTLFLNIDSAAYHAKVRLPAGYFGLVRIHDYNDNMVCEYNHSEAIRLKSQTPPAPTPASEGDVERVARAIIIARDGKKDGERRFQDPIIRKAYIEDAKAAIAAYNSKPDGEGEL